MGILGLVLLGASWLVAGVPTARTFDLPTVIAKVQTDKGPWGVAVDEDHNKVYITNYNGRDAAGNSDKGSLSVIDGNSLAVQTIRNGSVINPFAPAVFPAINKVFVTNNSQTDDGGLLTIMDMNNYDSFRLERVVGSISGGIVVDRQANKLFVASHGWRKVYILDANSLQRLGDPGVPGMAYSVAIDEALHRVYVTQWDIENRGNQVVSAIDGNSNSVIWTRQPRGEPYGVAVIPDNNRVLVTSNFGDADGMHGCVTVYDKDGNQIKEECPAQRAAGIAFNPNSRRIFVNSYFSDAQQIVGVLVLNEDLVEQTRFTNLGGIPDFGIGVNTRTGRVFVPLANQYDGTPESVIVLQDTPSSNQNATPTPLPTATPIAQPRLSVSTSQVSFLAQRDQPDLPPSTFTIRNAGGGQLFWQIVSAAATPDPHFVVSPKQGSATADSPATVTVRALGAYTSTVSDRYIVIGSDGSRKDVTLQLSVSDRIQRTFLPLAGEP